MIHIEDNFSELSNVMSRLTALASKSNLTQREEREFATQLAKSKMLLAGHSAGEIRNAEITALMKAAGITRLPEPKTRMDAETDQEWRKFAVTGECPAARKPEQRAVNEAGTQSLTFTQGIPGGYFVPQGFYDRAMSVMKQYDQVFDTEFHTPCETADGRLVPIPELDDVANQSTQIGETADSQITAINNFGQAQLAAYTFRSGVVPVSLELVQDSAFPIGSILERVFSIRHARGGGNAVVRGSGVNAPTGLLTASIAAGAKITIATGSSTNDGSSNTGSNSIGTNDLVNVLKNLDPAYRPGACWCMNDSTLRFFTGLLDKSGRPLFPDQIAGDHIGQPTLYGMRVAISPSMPGIGAASNSVVLYQPGNFVIRTVPSASYVRRYSQGGSGRGQSYVEAGVFGFESFLRLDSNLVSVNSNFVPASILQHHS